MNTATGPNRTTLTKGVEVTIRGLGRCRYQSTNADGTLNVTEPRCHNLRTVTADRLRVVHRKAKMR